MKHTHFLITSPSSHASEHGLPAASGQTTLLSARNTANHARLAGLADSAGLAWLVRVCTHAFYFPSCCHYTKSNPIDDHSNISSKKLQKQNFKPLGHYTCMQCGTSHLQKVQENILSHIILATYRKSTVATVRFTQNVSCNIFTHPIYQQVSNVTV